MTEPSSPSWELAHLLAEPTRRAVFDAVRQAREPLTRDEVAARTGVNRRLATFHLDRLAEGGVLSVDYARPAGRAGGPGAGRPAKRYAAAPIELDLTLPPRQYEFAARVLVEAIATAPTDAATAAMEVAHAAGRRIGELRKAPPKARSKDRSATLVAALADLGYEPAATKGGALRLRNCPFRSVADLAPDLVCGMNCELVRGLVQGLDQPHVTVTLEPSPPDCCVTVADPG